MAPLCCRPCSLEEQEVFQDIFSIVLKKRYINFETIGYKLLKTGSISLSISNIFKQYFKSFKQQYSLSFHFFSKAQDFPF